MLDLKRIYWTRQALRIVMLCSIMWLFTAAILSVRSSTIGQRPTSAIDILRPIFDAVLAAVTAPGLLVVLLVVVAVVIRSSNVGRRDPLRRFTR